jgi:hypothetical protein
LLWEFLSSLDADIFESHFTSNSLNRIETKSEPYRALLGGYHRDSLKVRSLCKYKKRRLFKKEGWRFRGAGHWEVIVNNVWRCSSISDWAL